MIIKSKHFKNFTVVDNSVLKEKNLSLKAKGLFCILCSLPPDWKILQSNLKQFSSDGMDATTNAFKELIEFGLIKVIGKESKKIDFKGNITYIVYPNLETANKNESEKIELIEEENPKIENAIMENTLLENPIMENPTLHNIYIQKKEEQNKDYTKYLNIYFDFFKIKNNFPPKLNGMEGKALKQIIKYLQNVTGDGLKAFQSFEYILSHWNDLSPYNQSKMRLVDINSNLANILIELKNNSNKNKSTSGKINKAYNETMNKLLKELKDGTAD